MKSLVGLLAGLILVSGSIYSNSSEIPKYEGKKIVYAKTINKIIEGDLLKVGVITYYDSNREDKNHWDIVVHSMTCLGKNKDRREYVLSIYDYINKRLFVFNILGDLEKIIEGEEKIKNFEHEIPKCPITI